MNITDFLHARIEEEETKAQQLFDDLSNQIRDEKLRPDDRGPYTPTRLLKSSLWAQYDGQTRWRNFARGQHIADLANPTRILAECEAKRKIIADWEAAEKSAGNYPTIDAGYALGLEVAVQHLAATYSNHPDYNQEWRPTN